MIKLIICDLDNTLYDWVGYFVPAFDAMLDELVRSTHHSEEALLASFRRVHQRHGTSEYALAVAELDVLTELDGSMTLADRLDRHSGALAAFREGRRKNLRLYRDVAPTLRRLRDDSRTIVAHTDAMTSYADARLHQLGIGYLFDGLWAQSDHEFPSELGRDELREVTGIGGGTHSRRLDRDIAARDLKPEPRIVREIMDAAGADPGETLYIGDNLSKDVLVAQRVGAIDVYAAYGQAHQREQYQRLVDVTHWTEDDVRRER